MFYGKTNIFGTDGIRGKAGEWPVSYLGCKEIAEAVVSSGALGPIRRVFIGRDTRSSGSLLERGLISGFPPEEVEVTAGGVLPTPAISFLTRGMTFDCGISITASHNPYCDNGIKIFNRDGRKLSDDQIDKINSCIADAHIDAEFEKDAVSYSENENSSPADLNSTADIYYEEYKNILLKSVGGDFSLKGLLIALDCANGANSRIAPRLFSDLGAEIASVGCSPDGKNINAGVGATCPRSLADLVLSKNANLGISFDGDGDRLIMCDETGHIIDGDAIIAVLASYMLKNGTLKGRGAVATIMSNLGLEVFLSNLGVKLYRSDVGDRSVAQMMLNKGLVLGGEQSGHIIIGGQALTGDGILSALHMIKCLIQSKLVASKAFRLFDPYPQLLSNLHLDKSILENRPVKDAIAKLSNEAKSKGCRIVVRPSGTEPLVRIMVEGKNTGSAQCLMDDLQNLLCQRRA